VPRLARVVLACLLTLAVAAVAPAAAAPADWRDVYVDYLEDGVIDGEYTPRELIAAAREKRGDPQYGTFAEAVDDALAHQIAGVKRTGPDRDEGLAPVIDDAEPPAGGSRSFELPSDAATPLLPAPRPPDERGNPPWPLLALSAMGGALVVTGAGSSAYRRLRPRRQRAG
jgi:hypothetical protein